MGAMAIVVERHRAHAAASEVVEAGNASREIGRGLDSRVDDATRTPAPVNDDTAPTVLLRTDCVTGGRRVSACRNTSVEIVSMNGKSVSSSKLSASMTNDRVRRLNR